MMKSVHLSEEHSMTCEHIKILDIAKSVNDIWVSLTGNAKVGLQTQENHQRKLLKGYCKNKAREQ